ncbi:MAG: 2-amino-4-hydroxy-6-hydroxymethyldihydropteridine diphosphokinase [Nitrospira sp.]|nr:2-amino-4-hydroxy-6-hydroxymethyldihydropteridine diphosphokinase [Candidatus Manganitrophaceae bacterium]HIL33864.1 2-amino-4-hydroxy-6-hydroxymethyldihydropteridine diphosphokinase [Candidatus Manganitrophaceae bacterium]
MGKEEEPEARGPSLDSGHQPRHLAYIGIGSNKEDAAASCRRAVQRLASVDHIWITKVSSLYETAPMCILDQNWFYNAVIEIETSLSPHQLLDCSQTIESQIGKKIVIPKGPREIDLDILFYDQEVINEPDLIIPHPSIPLRRFVLVPMVEIASGMRHPVRGQSVESLLKKLNKENDFMVIKKEDSGWERVRP